MHIAIILLNWNGKTDTLACLESLHKMQKTPHIVNIIVVDNASTDGSVAAIKKRFPKTWVLVNVQNEGFAQGNNVGITEALHRGADYLLLLNNDTTVHPHLLLELYKAAKQHGTKAIYTPKIYFYPGCEFHKDRYDKKDQGKVFWYAGGIIDWDNVLPSHRGVDEVDHGQYDNEEKTAYISGCAFFAHKSFFSDVGVFDPSYFTYYEDVDLSVRAKKMGYTPYYIPSAVVWHKNAGSSGGSGSSLHQYYMIRNQLIFGMRFAPIRAKLALLRQSIVIALKGNKWEKWGIYDYFLHRLGKTERQVL